MQSRFRKWLQGEPDENGEIRAYCPVHENPQTSKSASASFNFLTDLWYCHSCQEGGSINALYKKLAKEQRERRAARRDSGDDENVVDMTHRARKKSVSRAAANTTARAKPLPNADQLQQMHERLMKQPRLKAIMTDDRGLSDETLMEFQIGHDAHRFTIPVFDADGELVNVRRYNPQANKAQDKMLNITGHGTARIFRPDLLAKYKEVIITEGEMDMMVAHQHGLPAITHTAGAATFKNAWGPLFKDKQVFICYDDDDAGLQGAQRAAKILINHAESVHILRLNTGIKAGDISDYFNRLGNDADDFRALMKAAALTPWGRRRASEPATLSGKQVSIEESMNPSYGKQPLEMIVSIAGKQDPPYVLPKVFRATCDQDKGNVCAVCPMSARNGEHTETIKPSDSLLLEFVDVSEKTKEGILRKSIGARCADHVTYEVMENYTVEELLVTNSVDHRQEEEDQTPIHRRVLNVGAYKTGINSVARIVGRQEADPKTQRGIFQSWILEPTKTSIDKFTMSPVMKKSLEVFQTRDGQTPLEKCHEIAADLAANVTRIYGRPDLHIAYDLVWHSVLSFDFAGQRIDKGWLECLVIGDTRTGKSEAATKLISHYNAGTIKSCEGATLAGIVGGVQQMGTKWMVTWGVIPMQDRRLVVLDEVSGLKDKDVIEQMSAVRSSGRAQLTKIATEETSARTRLIWISNPSDGRRLHENAGSGMYAIQKLIPNPEDIARFDFALAAAGSDVSSETINTITPPQVKHRYQHHRSEALVLWAWSRTRDQVTWGDGVEDYVVKASVAAGERYVSEPPLVQTENIRVKIARMAVAFAARTFSCDETGEKIVVKKAHVDSAVQFLDDIYGTEAMGYLRHSRRVIQQRAIARERKDHMRRYLQKSPAALNGLFAIGDSTFKPRDFQDFAGMQDFEAQTLIQDLLKAKMIRRLSRGAIKMEPALIEILKEFEDDEHLDEASEADG